MLLLVPDLSIVTKQVWSHEVEQRVRNKGVHGLAEAWLLNYTVEAGKMLGAMAWMQDP